MYEFPSSFRKPATFEEVLLTLAILTCWTGIIFRIRNMNFLSMRFRSILFYASALLAMLCISAAASPPSGVVYLDRSGVSCFAILYISSTLLSACFIKPLQINSDIKTTITDRLKKLFVIALICIFLSVVSSNFSDIIYIEKHTRRDQYCLNNMRNLGVAVHNYATDHRGDIPPTAEGEPPRSWRVEILPLIEQQRLRETYHEELEWNTGENADVARFEIEVYQCPANPIQQTPEGFQLTGYAAVTGTNAMWEKQKSLNLEHVTQGDGLSQTLMIVEACGQNIAWSEPRDVDIDTMAIGINLPGERKGESNGILSSYHAGGANVVFGDGSGRALSKDTDPDVLKKLSTATGGEVLTAKEY